MFCMRYSYYMYYMCYMCIIVPKKIGKMCDDSFRIICCLPEVEMRCAGKIDNSNLL